MKNKFDIVFENILDDINKSYVTYELFDDWKKRVTEEMKSMTEEEAKKYVKKEERKNYDQIDKQEEISKIFNELFPQNKEE